MGKYEQFCNYQAKAQARGFKRTEEEYRAIQKLTIAFWKLVNKLRAKGKLPKSATVEIPDDCNDKELLDLKKLKDDLEHLKYRGRERGETSGQGETSEKTDSDEDEENENEQDLRGDVTEEDKPVTEEEHKADDKEEEKNPDDEKNGDKKSEI
ncbi:hypothetical protein E3N88_24441 [Mikania micrantha]|uniref:Uncharacterized protein n=1 Tax=Mikania micrantha TaxID=192012 RepID=A0A5N6N326_9ASTR|nr:hypothetical protein E3N88_24441 [Mikania micrantha]